MSITTAATMRPASGQLAVRSGRKQGGDDARELGELVSIGPAAIQDLALLGIHRVDELATCEAEALYETLCAVTGVRHDRCVQDVFAAGIAQARDPALPSAEKFWWHHSRERKRRAAEQPAPSSAPSPGKRRAKGRLR